MHQDRTHTCGELRRGNVEEMIRLSGWVHNSRDHGGVLFIDLRDHYGITQLVVNSSSTLYPDASHLPKETVICVDGKVVLREQSHINPKMSTGEIEVLVGDITILGPCGSLPLSVFPEDPTAEELRLKYRYLDLRRRQMHDNIVMRSRIIASIRRRMWDLGFNEYQTPTLTCSSPEGARDYLVPSRRFPGQFYALPQAPQLFKQILMISGFDRYFQIAACYRDEDARADRSPGEFYQLDIEMSFVTQEDVFQVVEQLLDGLFREFAPDATMTKVPFPRIPYDDAMVKYGTDKPDLRNPLQIRDISDLFEHSDFRLFAGNTVRVLAVPECGNRPRSFFDQAEKLAKSEGASGLAWLIVEEDMTLKGPVAKFITSESRKAILDRCKAVAGHALFFVADADEAKICRSLSALRTDLGERLQVIEGNAFRFCWIVDFPMYELDKDTGKTAFSHNPFSMPQGGLDALNTLDPLTIKAFQYDIICNGYELSSGAIRNHHPETLYRAFEIAGYSRSEVDDRFISLASALKFGAPPHGGIAPGIDRIVMLLAGQQNIREVIAVPLTPNAQDLMMNAASMVTSAQLRELHIKIEMPQET